MFNTDDITLISINWNQQPCIELLLKSYAKHHYIGYPLKIMLVDNGSQDSSKKWLSENQIPFFNFSDNIGHENAVNAVYEEVKTKYALLVDSDIEFISNVFFYTAELSDNRISAGEMIDKNYINSTKIKDRISPWFLLFDIQKAVKSGINTFRDKNCSDWTYDVASWFTEQLSQRGFSNYNIERSPGNQDDDLISMKYEKFLHIGKVSWDIFNKHQDRIDEVLNRRKYVQERLLHYQDISLKGKFVYG